MRDEVVGQSCSKLKRSHRKYKIKKNERKIYDGDDDNDSNLFEPAHLRQLQISWNSK